jgi:hypothetical protein
MKFPFKKPLNHTNMTHQQNLITAFDAIGVTVNENEIPEILAIGIDTFLTRRNYVSRLKVDYAGLHIILNTLRNG